MLARRIRHERVRGVEHALARAVVLRERDDLGLRAEAIRETEDVLDRGGAKRIDRLRVVADDGDALAVRLERMQDVALQLVRVLVLVDQHVVEMRGDGLRDARLRSSSRASRAAGRRSRARGTATFVST